MRNPPIIVKCGSCKRGITVDEIIDLQFTIVRDSKWKKPRFFCKECTDQEVERLQNREERP